MKKVVLLGDSIRLFGYGKKVAENLKPYAEVFQTEDNQRFAKYTLRLLFDLKDNIKGVDVIHWNNGIWDVCDLFGDGAFTDLDEYIKNMLRIAKILKTYSKKVIFATTTPASEKNPNHCNERTKEYNEAVVKALEKEGIIISDLYYPVLDGLEENICEDMLHLSQKGIDKCAKIVTDVIMKELKD